MQDKYLPLNDKNIYILKSDALKILGQYEFPIYADERVHFKDVFKVLVKKIFEENKLEYVLGDQIKKKL